MSMPYPFGLKLEDLCKEGRAVPCRGLGKELRSVQWGSESGWVVVPRTEDPLETSPSCYSVLAGGDGA